MNDQPPDITGLPIGHEINQPYCPGLSTLFSDATFEIKLYKEAWYNIWMVLPDENKKPYAKLIRKEYWKIYMNDEVEKEITKL